MASLVKFSTNKKFTPLPFLTSPRNSPGLATDLPEEKEHILEALEARELFYYFR